MLARQNRGRRAFRDLASAVSLVLGEPTSAINRTTLPETDALLESFRLHYQSAVRGGEPSYRRFFSRQDTSLVWKFARDFAVRLPTEEVYWLFKESKICGAVEARLSALLVNAESAIRLDGDAICVISTDREQGLLIDFNMDDELETFEVAAWGDPWTLVAAESAPK